MSREIKFRAWDKIHKRMHYDIGFYIYDDGSGYVFDSKNTPPKIGGEGWWLDVEEFILLQYTGLHDKNGKEIYEGDIVNKRYFNMDIYDGMGDVKMDIGRDSDGYHHGGWYGWMAGESSLYDVASKCEVISSIYENPELLKGEK